jgi:hypothetical protein
VSIRGNTVGAQVKLEGVDQWEKDAKRAEKALDNFGRGAKGITDNLRSIGPGAAVGVAGAVAAVGVIADVARAAAEAVSALAREMVELGRRGGEIAAISTAFTRLGNPQVVSQIRAMTGGLVQDTRLMQEFSQAARAGILRPDEIVQGFGQITRAAQDMGEPVEQMISQFAQAASGGGMEFLARLGVNYAEITTRVREMGLSMESAEGKATALRLGLQMMDAANGGVSNSAGNTGDAITQMEVALTNARDQIALAMATNQELIKSISDIAGGIQRAIPSIVRFGTIIAEMANTAIDWIHRLLMMVEEGSSRMSRFIGSTSGLPPIMRQAAEALQDFYDASGGTARRLRELTTEGEAFRDIQEQIARNAREFAREFGDLGPRGFSSVGGESYTGAPTGERPAARTRRGGGGDRHARAERMLAAELRPGQEILDALGAAATARAERMNEAVLAADRNRIDEERRLERELATVKDENHQKRMEQIREEGQERQAEFEKEREALEEANRLFEERRDRILNTLDAASGAWQTQASMMTEISSYYQEQVDSITDVMKAQGASNEQITQATKSQRETIATLQKIEGAFLVAYNISMAVTEVAKAIGSYPDPAGIIAHSASAAAHVVAAGVAAARLGGGAASAPTVSAAGTFKPSATDKVPEQSGEGGGVTIVKNYYLSENMAQLGVAAERGRYEMRRQNTEAGLPNVGWDV